MIDSVEIGIPSSHRNEFHDVLQAALADQCDTLPSLNDETVVDPETGIPRSDVDSEAVRAAFHDVADDPETVDRTLDLLFALRASLRDHKDTDIYDDYTTTVPRALCASMAESARDEAEAAENPPFTDAESLTDLADRYRDIASWLEQATAEQ